MIKKAAGLGILVLLATTWTSMPAQSYTTLGVTDLRRAYGVSQLIGQGYTGKGITVVVITSRLSNSFSFDVREFAEVEYLPETNLTVMFPYGQIGNATNPESSLDVEIVHGIAPGARIIVLVTGNRILDGIEYAIDNKIGQVVTVSYGAQGSGTLAKKEFLAHGVAYSRSVDSEITLVTSSGDRGTNNSAAEGTFMMPQESPYFVTVGGTFLARDMDNSFSETGWVYSGGGPSLLFDEPAWQQNSTVPATGRRNFPDIALMASCDSPVRVVLFGQKTFGCGTSVSAPLFAGILADIYQKAGGGMGFINPALYSIARSDPSAFQDVKEGCSLFHSQDYPQGYCAKQGWDFVTGLGAVNATRLADDLISAVCGSKPSGSCESSHSGLQSAIKFPFAQSGDIIAIIVVIAIMLILVARKRRSEIIHPKYRE